MTPDLITDIRERLQVCLLTLESIEETTDPAIVQQRVQNVVKQLVLIGRLLPPPFDQNGDLAAEGCE